MNRPQYPPQQPPSPDDEIAIEIIRAIVHIIAEHHMDSDFVDKLAAIDNHPEFIAELCTHNDINERRIAGRSRQPKAPAKPLRRMASGSADHFTNANSETRALFESALRKVGK